MRVLNIWKLIGKILPILIKLINHWWSFNKLILNYRILYLVSLKELLMTLINWKRWTYIVWMLANFIGLSLRMLSSQSSYTHEWFLLNLVLVNEPDRFKSLLWLILSPIASLVLLISIAWKHVWLAVGVIHWLFPRFHFHYAYVVFIFINQFVFNIKFCIYFLWFDMRLFLLIVSLHSLTHERRVPGIGRIIYINGFIVPWTASFSHNNILPSTSLISLLNLHLRNQSLLFLVALSLN